MKLTRPRLLSLMLAASAAAWLCLLALQRQYDDGPNYSRIEDGLYLGGFVDTPPPGTRAVLNLCEQDDPYRREFHLWEPIADAEPAPDLAWLRRVVGWVDDRRRAGVPTFVHCRNGVSRSGMVVTAYVMARDRRTRDEALAYVRERRPAVRPNPAFLQLLLEWEEELKTRPVGDRPPG
jgi:hypothetical protein